MREEREGAGRRHVREGREDERVTWWEGARLRIGQGDRGWRVVIWACVAWVRVARSLLRHVCGMGVCGALSPKACAALT